MTRRTSPEEVTGLLVAWSEAEPQGDEAQEKDEPALAGERTMKNDFIHGDTIRCEVISGPTSVAHFVGS